MLIELIKRNIVPFLSWVSSYNVFSFIIFFSLYHITMYAVIALQWHQYIVSKGSTIIVDQLPGDLHSTITSDVLAFFNEDGSDVQIGTPVLPTKALCEIISHQKGDKIRVVKFKRKNRYERNFGHRSYQTTLTVISLDGK